jgi:hypothetical protein
MDIRNSVIGILRAGPVPALLAVAMAACGSDRTPQPGAGASAGARPANPLIAMQAESVRSDPRAQIFLEKGCPQCHRISGLGIVAQIEAGPDLTIAYEDVRSRFNVPLDSFLANPTGTMQIVLSAQIRLTPEERDSIYRLLRDLHEHR